MTTIKNVIFCTFSLLSIMFVLGQNFSPLFGFLEFIIFSRVLQHLPLLHPLALAAAAAAGGSPVLVAAVHGFFPLHPMLPPPPALLLKRGRRRDGAAGWRRTPATAAGRRPRHFGGAPPPPPSGRSAFGAGCWAHGSQVDASKSCCGKCWGRGSQCGASQAPGCWRRILL